MLNDALRLIREFHSVPQAELARRFGISRSYLCEIESGKKAPNMEILNQYHEVFRIPPSTLLLFSEKLADDNFSERSRASAAKKILKILDWIADTEDTRSATSDRKA